MEVTKSNFASLLPSIKEAIDECDFLAVDTELTGLSTKVTEHAFDTIAERYSKLRENCMQFLIIQYGLSAFKYHRKEHKFTHKDFNFYVFPRPHIRQAPDPKFMCQTSSLHFLASQNFDFNKVINEGISYLQPAQEQKIRDVLANKHKMETEALSKNGNSKSNGQKPIDVPKEEEQFIADVHERIDAFILNDAETELELEPCNSYRRKLIYDTVQQKYETGIDMHSVVNKDNKKIITIVKTTEEEKYDKLKMKQINDIDDLEAAVGFRKVLDHIVQSKKLIIGHNMLLDLMHTLHQFYSPLPEKLDEFKEMLHSMFPQIMDTKLLATSEKLRPFFEMTHLTELVQTLQGNAFKLVPIESCDGFKGYDLESNKAHEAGFDAFLTGFSYVGMAFKLSCMLNSGRQNCHNPEDKHLKPYCNRLYIMKHHDICALNICAPDPEPDRDNVFYVSFPEEWKTIDLVELFLPYGNIYVNWLDDVSALVALKNRENIINAKTNLLNKTSRLYTVRSYADYHRAMNKQSVIKKTTDVKKTQTSSANEPFKNKRRASGSAESMELIPEGDENEAEKAENSEEPSAKRQKRYNEENDAEVTSTAKVFEEENTW